MSSTQHTIGDAYARLAATEFDALDRALRNDPASTAVCPSCRGTGSDHTAHPDFADECPRCDGCGRVPASSVPPAVRRRESPFSPEAGW